MSPSDNILSPENRQLNYELCAEQKLHNRSKSEKNQSPVPFDINEGLQMGENNFEGCTDQAIADQEEKGFLQTGTDTASQENLKAHQSVTSLYQRDMALQVMRETLNYPKSHLCEETILDEYSNCSTENVSDERHLGDTSVAGGDAWRTIQVGCAEVTHATENRVVLQGAYIQQRPNTVSTSKEDTLNAGNQTLIPFRFVFLKKSGTSNKTLSLKGTFSRPRLDSPAEGIEIWGFQV
ncbi:hypothetical protein EGW08_011131 [Elysia chlorotica]|uniref:Uncharacterized protein n=1 Tax=Elysia chlorotica TaxID=188477 RepID=A0A433THV5_ELYCH|nr:hypothetical protein EGW08_011131 [Elysia chlorotica]